jgi:transketolase
MTPQQPSPPVAACPGGALSGRDAYRAALTELAATDPAIVCIEADLGGRKHAFAEAHPDRFFNVGIAEAAMIDMAAGLAAGGFKPFVSTFAPFATLRAAESFKLALGYLGAPITVVAPYAGVSGAWFGTTHHCLEDLAVARAVPGVVIAAPYGEAEMRAVVTAAADSGRPHYIRTGRNAAYDSLPPTGTGRPLVNWANEGASGAPCLVSVGEEATRLCLEATALDPGLAHAHLCYVDNEHLAVAAKELAARHGRLTVVEEHRRAGGVAEALALLLPECRVNGASADDRWPTEGGDHAETLAQIGLTVTAVLETAAQHRHHQEIAPCTSS